MRQHGGYSMISELLLILTIVGCVGFIYTQWKQRDEIKVAQSEIQDDLIKSLSELRATLNTMTDKVKAQQSELNALIKKDQDIMGEIGAYEKGIEQYQEHVAFMREKLLVLEKGLELQKEKQAKIEVKLGAPKGPLPIELVNLEETRLHIYYKRAYDKKSKEWKWVKSHAVKKKPYKKRPHPSIKKAKDSLAQAGL